MASGAKLVYIPHLKGKIIQQNARNGPWKVNEEVEQKKKGNNECLIT